ncbi:hypothetical protein HY251_08355, partial [bacterium]|nr:hypothetical protein [bacterium]
KLWARIDGPPDSRGQTWVWAEAPGALKRVGIFVKDGAASFGQVTLDAAR